MGHLLMSWRAALQIMVTNPYGHYGSAAGPGSLQRFQQPTAVLSVAQDPLTHTLGPRWISEEAEFPLHPLHSQ